MADLGSVGASASAGSGDTYRPNPLGLTAAQYGAAGKDAEPLPFIPTVPLTELVGAVPI